MAHEQALEIIATVLASLRPAIQGHGGDIEFAKYEHNIVYVKFHGTCVHCPISMMTLKLGVEETLKEKLPDLEQVIAID